MEFKSSLLFFIVILIIANSGCKETWDEHYSVKDNNLEENLIQAINNTPELSNFANYLKSTAYADALGSSKGYIVFAPTNDAFSNIPQAFLSDSAKLNQLIGYYISLPTNLKEQGKLQMLNGKYTSIQFSESEIQDATILSEKAYKNGVLYTINSAYLPLPNIWEYLRESESTSKQKTYIENLYAHVFDKENSAIIGVDQQTGETIYDTVTVWQNLYLSEIADLTEESMNYTFLVLSDVAYDDGFGKYRPYYKPADSLDIDSLAKFNVCADLVFYGSFTEDNLPDSIRSTTGIYANLDASHIESSITCSNGVIHYINTFPFKESNKFKAAIIEGERLEDASTNLYKIVSNDSASNSYYLFYDHNSNGTFIQYSHYFSYPAIYEFYWVAKSNPLHNQLLGLYRHNPGLKEAAQLTFPLVATTSDYTTEVLLGRDTITEPKYISMKVFSESSTSPPPISLDYIKIVPVNQ